MRKYDDFFYSGFRFKEEESLLKFQFKMINYIFILVSFFSLLFGLLSDLGINDIGIYAKVDYVYSFLTFCLIFLLRASKNNYLLTARLLLTFSMIAFTFALILVPQDEFRLIWFYLTVLVAYILGGKVDGIFFTVVSIVIILVVNSFMDLQLSGLALNSAVLGLIIGSSVSLVYANKIQNYERSLYEKTKELHILANTDGLTGIMNKRCFDDVVVNDFELAQRTNRKISLLLLDVDYFKSINDEHGHNVGDTVLIEFTKIIQGFLRKSDLFARIGGDEFAIVLLETGVDEALLVADKICSRVDELSLKCNEVDIGITTSIGLSQNLETDRNFNEIFERADKALYQSKNEGRNQVNTL